MRVLLRPVLVPELGLVVLKPGRESIQIFHNPRVLVDLTDYQWYKGYADVIGKLVTKCWQEEAYAEAQLRKVTR
ncbi:hypothetical protein MKMAFJJD_004512 [Escherichia coli]|nr:hypothetical protein [Escherichia coli]